MQIHLPVHQPPCHQEFLDGIDTFDLHDQPVIPHIQHFQQTLARHTPFLYAREERVAAEIVHAVHIQLAADQLMEEMLRVLVFEDSYCHVQRFRPLCTSYIRPSYMGQVFIDPLHHEQRDVFVGDAVHERMLQHVGERPVPYIMQQDRYHRGCSFFLRYLHALHPQGLDCLVHQVHCSERVSEAAVCRPRIDQIGQT